MSHFERGTNERPDQAHVPNVGFAAVHADATAMDWLPTGPSIETALPSPLSATPQDPRNARDMLSRFFGSATLRVPRPQARMPLCLAASSLNALRFLVLEHDGEFVLESPGLSSAHVLIVPLRGALRHRLEQQVQHAQPGAALVRNPGAHIHLTAEAPLRVLFVRVDANAVSARLLRLLRRPLREEIAFGLHLDLTGEGRSLWNTLLWICRELDTSGNLFRRSSTLAHEAETLLIDTLLTIQASNYSEDLRAVSSVAVPRHLRTVLTAIDAAPQSTWSLGEMARTGGVSVRTLCDAFRHFRGCTPMEFVRSVRLSRARDDLRRPGQGVSIADVARRWGFGHPGRFAATYRSTYGQTPSETLRFGVGQEAD